MGCIYTIFELNENVQHDEKQYVSLQNEQDELPSNNLLNISNISGINLNELLSLHNSFQLYPDKTIIFNEEEVDILQSLENELKIDNQTS